MTDYRYPNTPYTIGKIGDVDRILDRNGNDVIAQKEGMQRLVTCANSLKHIYSPAAHVPATDAYIKKLLDRIKGEVD